MLQWQVHALEYVPTPPPQLDNVGSVFLINLMQSALQLAARLSDRASDDLWMAWLYGDRGADAMCSQMARVQTRGVELHCAHC